HACAAALQNSLGVDPSAPTQAAYRQVMALPAPAALPSSTLSAPILVGRADEWKRLCQEWQSAAAGRPQVTLVSGEAGIGKTRLVADLAAWVGRQGNRVATAACYQAEGRLPFAPVTTWLRSHPLPHLGAGSLAEVARLMPELVGTHPDLRLPGPIVEEWQRQRLFEAMAHALLDGPQPLLLVIEDLQWCDRDTLEWLHFLLRYDSGAGLLVLGTGRTDEVGADHPLTALVQALRRSRQILELELCPLDRDGTAELAGQLQGAPLRSDIADQVHRATAGNPLYIVESVRAGLIEAWATGSKGVVPISPALQSVLGPRLAQLSPAAHELIGLAATFNREFAFPILCAASRLTEEGVVRALDELWRRRLVREHGARSYVLSHDLLRDLVYAQLAPATRRWHHRRIAEALVTVHAGDLDAAGGEIARHYELAGLAEQAVPYYVRAAEGARRTYATEQALAAYRRALEVLATLPPGDPVRRMVVAQGEALGDVLVLVARHDEAIDAYERALTPHLGAGFADASVDVTHGRLLRKIAAEQVAAGRLTDSVQTYGRALASLTGRPEPWPEVVWQEWIEIQLGRAWLCYWQSDVAGLLAVVDQLRPALEGHGTPLQRATFLHTLIELNQRRERFQISDETLGYARALYATGRKFGSPEQLGTAELVLGLCLLWHGDLDASEGHLQAARAAAEATGDNRLKARGLLYLGLLHRLRREVAEATAYSREGLAAAEAGQWATLAGLAHGNLAWVAAQAQDWMQVEESAQAALGLWGELPYPFRWVALYPLMASRLANDDLAGALTHARTLLDPGQQRLPDSLAEALEAALSAWRSGREDDAAVRLIQALDFARSAGYA
ncbi:MAG TPA: AAA family ATPase, partial [Anaerolineae bacterium]